MGRHFGWFRGVDGVEVGGHALEVALANGVFAIKDKGVFAALVLRNGIGTLLMLPVWAAKAPGRPSRTSLLLHAKRSAVVACMAPLFFWGLVRMPISEAIALSFIAPLIALYLEDAWELSPNLTATLGVRWDYDTLTQRGAGRGL